MPREGDDVSAVGGIVPTMLTVKDTMTLDFEARRWRYAGAKDVAIRETFGESSTLFYQRLNHLLDHPEAEVYAPQMVHRLRRLRDRRLEARSSRRIGWAP